MGKKIIWGILIFVSVSLIIAGIITSVTSVKKKQKNVQAQTQQREWWVMEGYATSQLMEREEKQGGYMERTITNLPYNNHEIKIIYIARDGTKKMSVLTRVNENDFYVGTIENTHPDAKRKELPLRLAPWGKEPYRETEKDPVTGRKIEIFHLFEGWIGNTEMSVRVSKKVITGG